jgi:hypothetical protein
VKGTSGGFCTIASPNRHRPPCPVNRSTAAFGRFHLTSCLRTVSTLLWLSRAVFGPMPCMPLWHLPLRGTAFLRGSAPPVPSGPAEPPLRPAGARNGDGLSARQHPCWHADSRSVAWVWVATLRPLFVPAHFCPQKYCGGQKWPDCLSGCGFAAFGVYPPPPPVGVRGKRKRRVSRGFRFMPRGWVARQTFSISRTGNAESLEYHSPALLCSFSSLPTCCRNAASRA